MKMKFGSSIFCIVYFYIFQQLLNQSYNQHAVKLVLPESEK